MTASPEQPHSITMATHLEKEPDISIAYDEYKKEMLKLESLARKGQAGQLVLERINELKKIFASVTDNEVRELSMYMKDSDAFSKTAKFASTNAENIDYGDLGGSLPLDHYLKAVKKFMNPDIARSNQEIPAQQTAGPMNEIFHSFKWDKLGDWFFSKGKVATPSYFLCGPLATQRRRMAPRARAVDDTLSSAAKTTAKKVNASEIDNDPEQSTSQMVLALYNVIMTKNPDTKVGLYRVFINPHSYGQSVENLFYISFLVRDGRIKIDEDANKEPFVEIVDNDEDEEDQEEDFSLSHYIASLDKATWEWLIGKYAITDSYIPHRISEEDTINDSSDESVTDEDT